MAAGFVFRNGGRGRHSHHFIGASGDHALDNVEDQTRFRNGGGLEIIHDPGMGISVGASHDFN
jgi:hypothetical protein